MLPAASVARTLNVCEPVASPSYVLGDVHGAKAAESNRHSNVEPVSLEENANVASVAVTVPDGPP